MASLHKKLTLTLFAALAVVCLIAGVFFTASVSASADTTPSVLADEVTVLDSDDDFAYSADNKTITGLSDAAKGEVGNNSYSIVIPDSVEVIGARAFLNSANLTEVRFSASAHLKQIGASAFSGCTKLANVALPTSQLTEGGTASFSIGQNAFSGCTSLTEITVPTYVTSIGADAFAGCISVNTINYYAVNCNPMLSASPFLGLNANKEVKVNIGNGTTAITYVPAYLFKSTNIKEVAIDTVTLGETDFHNSIFENCQFLTKVTFKNSTISTIGTGVFNGCASLKDINLSALSSLKTIGESAFFQCSSLYQITIPANVDTIGTNAFQSCNRLVEVNNWSSLAINAGQQGLGYVGYYAKNVYNSSEGGDTKLTEDTDGFIFYEKDNINNALLIGYVGSNTKLVLPSGSYKVYYRAFFNNKTLEEVTIPAGVLEINDFAFYGCTALSTVNFTGNTSIATISSYAFANCNSLTEITIPASVQTINDYVFQNCSKLNTVNFGADNNLKTINTGAFMNCVSLEVIEIPSSVNAFGSDVFKGCTKLAIVYLPTALNSYEKSGLFDSNTKDDRLLIAPTADSYSTYASYSSTWNNYGKLTYEVPVYLVYGDYVAEGGNGEHHIEYKLFGLDYKYNKTDNVWALNGGMPVQHGYSRSVWYDNSEYNNGNGNVVDGVMLNSMLENDGDTVSTITLYADYYEYEKLDFTLQASGIYSEGTSLQPLAVVATWKYNDTVLTAEQYADRFKVEIVNYSPVTGSADTPDVIKEAGTYTICVNLNEKYGQWDAVEAGAYIEKEYIVNPIVLSLSADGTDGMFAVSDYINWGVVGSNEALSPKDGNATTLYIYNDIPYSTVQANSNLGPLKTVEVLSSYVLYKNSGWTIDLRIDDNYLKEIKEYIADDNSSISVNGITASKPGIYTAKVRFISDNNHRFSYTKLANDPYGITISETKTAEGYEYLLTKTWYIVTADASELIAAEGGVYQVTGWTYGATVPGAPHLSSEVTSGKEDDLITFTLENEAIFGASEIKTYSYNEYDKVINSSMPVGTYTLTVYVKSYTDPSSGAEIPGNGSEGSKWTFDVAERNIDTLLAQLKAAGKISATADLWGDLYTTQAIKKSFEVEYKAGKVQFADTSSAPVLKLNEEDIHTRKGIWAEPAYKDYFGGFKIVYNVKELASGTDVNKYYTAETYPNGPVNPGKYTVYFNVTANNYTSKINITDETERTNYYYTLYIKEYIDISTLNPGSVPYTGSAIRFKDTDIYKYVYLDGSATDSDTMKAYAVHSGTSGKKEDYVKASASVTVAVMIRSIYSDIYGWKNGETFTYGKDTSSEQVFAKFTFEISRTNNSSTKALYLRDWEWNTESNFNIQWATQYGTEADYTFTLQSVADKTLVYYYNPTATQLGFDKADAGEYTLIATCAGGEGYNWNEYRETRPVYIHQSRVTLDTNPYIESWRYGDYKDSEDRNPVYAFAAGFNSLASNVTYYITKLADYNKYLEGTIQKEDMTSWATLADMLDANGEISVGSYVYVLELPESGNYAEWSHEVYFSVLQVGNYWETTPTVHDWVYGDYTTRDTTINCQPHFGNKNSVVYHYRYVGVSGWVTVIPEDWFDKYGELSVGQYEFRAFLQGNDNYADLESHQFFNVTKAANSWKEDGIPGVNSWSQGRWDSAKNALSAQAKYGEVTFAVYSTSDTERKNAYDINNLNALGVGSYILVATVAGTSDYETLVGEATFAVFEDSVGMTGIIAATAVFAVIAIGLAVCGVVLLIIRNKKIEEEFRKMIKSELRRK